MHILDKIVNKKKEEIKLEKSTFMDGPTVSLSKYISREDKSGIIAEFKRKSPSRPNINPYADVEDVTIGYMQAGASALSILTDEYFFGGSAKDLITARKNNFCPILRKDFIIDEYQIIEARSIGADAILLICEILSQEEVRSLAKFAKSLDLEVLLELHSEAELNKICEEVNVIGVNNRDLKIFKTDLNFSVDLFTRLPADKIKISESGIYNVEDIIMLQNIGYQGFLIGEKFMTEASPADACMRFINNINTKRLENVN